MPSLTPIDFVDIIIVAYFLYKVMMLIRGTRATSIIKGLLLLFGANLISGFLGLRTVNYILEQGTTVILIALPVLFYPELRRALEHLGRGQIFTRFAGFDQEEIARVTDILARGAALLSDGSIGALIVVERDVGLEEYVESGVRMNAHLSLDLLLNVFTPDTPLHDGAVIVRERHIAAAGCFLPLTDNPYVSSQMGTRHRAALGVSEQSDALAIVVSEETGTISLAVGGRIERQLTEEDLRIRLTKALAASPGFSLMKRGRNR